MIVVGDAFSGVKTELAGYVIDRSVCIVSLDPIRRCKDVCGELDEVVGEKFGYTVPFEDQSSWQTRIKYVTPEMVLLEAFADPLFKHYDVIVVEDVDRRDAWTDVVVGVLYKVINVNQKLKLILTTESVECVEILRQFFQPQGERIKTPQVVQIDSSTGINPVDILHLESPVSDYVDAGVDCLVKIVENEPEGDVLVLLSCRSEVQRFIALFNERNTAGDGVVVAPYHSSSGMPDFRYDGKRHVMVAAMDPKEQERMETAYVIDCGFYELDWFDGLKNVHSKITRPITKAHANFRANLAGRFKPGKCFRLYTEQAATTLLPSTPDQGILGYDISEIILKLKALGIDNVARSFKFIPPSPPSTVIASGLTTLYSLGAIDDMGKLTKEGTIISELPVSSIYLAKAVAASGVQSCLEEVLRITACSLAGGISTMLYRPAGRKDREDAEIQHDKFKVLEGDHLTLLNIFDAFYQNNKPKDPRWAGTRYLNYRTLTTAVQYYTQLKRYSQRLQIGHQETLQQPSGKLSERILLCLVQGFFRQVAKRKSPTEYALIGTNKGQVVTIDRDSVLSSIAKKHPSMIIHGLQSNDSSQHLSPWIIYEALTDNDTTSNPKISGISIIPRSLLQPYYKTVEP